MPVVQLRTNRPAYLAYCPCSGEQRRVEVNRHGRGLWSVELLRRHVLHAGFQLALPKSFYITTPIYYVNGAPHVGTATSTIIADAINRFQKLRGRTTYFLTGTDEHAPKVAVAAAKAGKPPKEFVDDLAARFADTWRFLHIAPDRFIRTTDHDHKDAVAEVFRRLYKSGDIYKGTYSGWYSIADETYYTDSEVEDGVAKETGSAVEPMAEENYYFRLSAYGGRLLEQIEAQPDFLMPETRRNEVVAFINEGLRDVPISRRNAGWGIPAPDDPDQVIYVWFDALVNYLAATGWPGNTDWRALWPADAHIMGKEIYTRFHATLWPAMLMGLGIPLPNHVIGHGWWLIAGEKGSKSKGNIPAPQEVVRFIQDVSGAKEALAVDALRYYLLRDISFTGDADFSNANLTARYNGELANDLGNLLNRSLRMLAQYEDSVIPDGSKSEQGWSEIATLSLETANEVVRAMDGYNPGQALEAIARFVSANNKALDTAAPWKRAAEGDTVSVRDALYTALEANRILSVLLDSFMPTAARELRGQLGLPKELTGTWDELIKWGQLKPGIRVSAAEPLFPRIDKAKVAALAAVQPYTEDPKKQPKATMTTPESTISASAPSDKITIDDFMRVQLRVAEIKTAERIEGAKKLLRLTIDVGEAEYRQLVAGIAESYAPEDLPGRKIVVVANLQPAVIRGVESNGMLLAATDEDGRAIMLHPDKDVAAGAKVK
jgi:methionyl-tRNA synthetase